MIRLRRGVKALLRCVPRSKSARVGCAILGGFVLMAILGPHLAPYSATDESCAAFAPPSAEHWLGCDDGGVDVVSELIQGGRISLLVGSTATLVAMVIGGGIGVLAGYFGGTVDTLLMRVTDYFLVIPGLVLMIVVADVWGPSLSHVILVLGVFLWASTARLIRSQVKSVRERVYIKRCRSIGMPHRRILVRHVIPQIGALLVANTVLTAGLAIYYESALAFLGLSDPTAVTWGKLIQFAFLQNAVTVGAWWMVVPPGVCITLLVIACYLVGQAIEDALNPRLRLAHQVAGGWRWRSTVQTGASHGAARSS